MVGSQLRQKFSQKKVFKTKTTNMVRDDGETGNRDR